MVKHYCDGCGKEIEDRSYIVQIYRHIKNENILDGHCQIINGEFHPVSGMTDNVELCLICYNKVMYPLWESIKELKNEEIN